MNRVGSVRDTYTAFVLIWVAGLVAGLLLRTTGGSHGILAAFVVVATSAGAGGWGFYHARERDRIAGSAIRRLRAQLEDERDRRLP